MDEEEEILIQRERAKARLRLAGAPTTSQKAPSSPDLPQEGMDALYTASQGLGRKRAASYGVLNPIQTQMVGPTEPLFPENKTAGMDPLYLKAGTDAVGASLKDVGNRLYGATLAASAPLVGAVHGTDQFNRQLDRASMASVGDPELEKFPSRDPLLESVTFSGAPGMDPALMMEYIPRLVTAIRGGQRLTVAEREGLMLTKVTLPEGTGSITRITPAGDITVNIGGKAVDTTLDAVTSAPKYPTVEDALFRKGGGDPQAHLFKGGPEKPPEGFSTWEEAVLAGHTPPELAIPSTPPAASGAPAVRVPKDVAQRWWDESANALGSDSNPPHHVRDALAKDLTQEQVSLLESREAVYAHGKNPRPTEDLVATSGAPGALPPPNGIGGGGPPIPPSAPPATPLPPDPEGVSVLVDAPKPVTALGPIDQKWQDFLRRDIAIPYGDKELRVPFTDKTVTPQEMYDFYKRGSLGAIAGQDYDEMLKVLAAKKYAARVHSVEEAVKTKDALAALDGPDLKATFEAMRAGDPIPTEIASKIGPNFFNTNDLIRANRKWSMDNGMLGESSFDEFPDWFQVIYEKKAIESANKKGGFAKGVGFRLDPKMARENGYGIVLQMSPDEAKALVGDAKTKFLAPINKSEVYVKFPNDPAGQAAEEAIAARVPKEQITYRHGPISPEARKELGEVTDLPALMGNAVYRTSADKAKGEFLLGIRDNPEWTTTVPQKDIAKVGEDVIKAQLKEAGYELVPASKGWGPLRGNDQVRYAVKSEQMAPLTKMMQDQGFMEKGLRGLLKGWVKNALTTLGAASRNMFTNQGYAFMHGMAPWSGNSVGRQVKAANAFVMHDRTGIMDETTRYLVDHGVMMGSPTEQMGTYADTYRNVFKDYGTVVDAEKAWENAFDAATGSPLGEATMRIPFTNKTIPAPGVRILTGAVQGGLKAQVEGNSVLMGMAKGAGKNVAYGQKIPGLGISGMDAIKVAWQGGDPVLKHALFEFHVDEALAKGLPIEKAREFALGMVMHGTQNYAIQTGGFTEATKALGFPFMAFKEADREIKTFLLSQGPTYAMRTSAVMWQKKLVRAAAAGVAAKMGYDMVKWAQAEKQNPQAVLIPTGNGKFEAMSDDYLLTDAFEVPDLSGQSGLGHPLIDPILNISSIRNAAAAGDVSKAVGSFHGMPLVGRGKTAGEAILQQIQDLAPMSPGGRINRMMQDTLSKEFRNQSGVPYSVPRTMFQMILSRVDPGSTIPEQGQDYTAKEQALLLGFRGKMRALTERHTFDQKDINLPQDEANLAQDGDGIFVNPQRRRLQLRLLHDTVDLMEASRSAGVPIDLGPMEDIKALLYKVEGGDVGAPPMLKPR